MSGTHTSFAPQKKDLQKSRNLWLALFLTFTNMQLPTFAGANAEERMDGCFSFGKWVQRRRQALHLTQSALARQVACSSEMIRKIEADARRPSSGVAERLAEQLALAPGQTATFLEVAHAQRPVDWLGIPEQIADTLPAVPPQRGQNLPVPL